MLAFTLILVVVFSLWYIHHNWYSALLMETSSANVCQHWCPDSFATDTNLLVAFFTSSSSAILSIVPAFFATTFSSFYYSFMPVRSHQSTTGSISSVHHRDLLGATVFMGLFSHTSCLTPPVLSWLHNHIWKHVLPCQVVHKHSWRSIWHKLGNHSRDVLGHTNEYSITTGWGPMPNQCWILNPKIVWLVLSLHRKWELRRLIRAVSSATPWVL